MKASRKEEILSAATTLFNQHGFGAISLYDVAKHLGISRGNLTYHFKTKDDVLEAIAQKMWSKMDDILAESRLFPSFKNLHKQTVEYVACQTEFAFIFLDNQVLTHPIIESEFKAFTKQGIESNKMALAFAITNGNVHPEPFNGAYNNVAFLSWNIGSIWTLQQVKSGELSVENLEVLMWSIIYPHFTEKGKKAFYAFFGDDVMDKLGTAFETKAKDFILF